MKMKKSFLILSMVLLGLLMNTTSAWGYFGGRYYAKLTGRASTTATGSGKVYVSSTDPSAVTNWASKRDLEDYPNDEQWAAWEEGESNVEYVGSIAAADGIDMIASQFVAYAKADDGSYFAGWSFSDGATDEGTDPTLGLKLYPSKTRATLDPEDTYQEDGQTVETYGTVTNYNAKEYDLYATFEALLIENYIITGSNTTAKPESVRSCTQTVTFRIAGKDVDEDDFYEPTLTKKTGTTGTWTKGVVSVTAYENYGEIVVPVTFTAADDNVGEFSATLQLRSKAGKTMNVVLSARTTGGDYQAIRYNSSKEQQETGNLATLLTNAVAGDIIKLNDNYGSAVSLNKNITFDLNGFILNNTLTVSGGNVTIAYSPYGGSANALSVTGGKAILNGGTFGTLTVGASGTVEQNGAAFTGTATNNGSLTTTDGKFQSGLESSKTLVVNGGTFTGATAINVTAGTAQIKKGTITGTTYGVQSAGTTTIEKLAVISGNTMALNCTGGTLTVNNGKFTDPNKLASGDIVFNAAYFQTNSTEAPTVRGKQVWRNTAGAEAREGYNFFAGSQAAAQAYSVSVCRIGQAAYATLEDALAYANNHTAEQVTIFMENDYTLKAGYYTVPSNATLIVPMSNEQQTANPIVPRSTAKYSENPPVSFRKLIFENGVNMEVAGTIELTGTQYYTGESMGIPGGKFGHLIMKPGSHMTINTGGELRAWGFVTGDGTRDASGTYLSGEIDARRGSVVREMFQMGDWKGGDISFTMILDQAPQNMTYLFPVYMYFIQNIELPVKYHPGSSLLCAASVNVSGDINAFANEIKLVGKEGEPAMFLMDEMADAENTWVRKWYDAAKDQQVYEVNSGAQLGSLVIDLGEVPGMLFGGTGKFKIILDSRKFVLPLTSNMKIHLLSGYMEFTQSTSCLPGMEVEVDKESEISVIPNEDATVRSGALYFYDADQWSFMNLGLGGYVGNSGNYGAIVRYSATWDLATSGARKRPNVRDVSSPAAIGDAKLIVHGTFRSASGCSVYTTWSKGTGSTPEDNPFVIDPDGTGGACIISTNEDAGTFIFDNDSPEFDGVHWDNPANFGQMDHLTGFGNSVLVNYDHNDYSAIPGMPDYYPIRITTVLKQNEYSNLQERCNNGDEAACEEMVADKYWTRIFGYELCTPAMLKNADGTFTETEGTLAGTSYCYMNGQWTTMQVAEDECFMKEIVGGQTTYYAKPAEYVAVVATYDDVKGVMKGNDDHTFSDKAGAGRLFILMEEGCQWWEVENEENLYHCIHPNNDTYYYWDEGESKWKEKRYTITWKNWDGSEIKSYTYDPVTGEPDVVEYSVTYGTQAEYLGSNPTRPADIDYTYNFTGWSPALGKVTSDVTYTATYEKQERKYTIIFQNEGGDEIERQFLTHNATPKCENVPTRTGFTLEWEPAISAVVGDATYRATWLEEPPTEYQVTFFDYDGETVLQQGNVAVGAMPEYAGETPTGKATWAAVEENKEFTYEFDHWSPAPEIVSATSVKSYVAVYDEVPITYTVIFQNENGAEIESHDYAWGETPICSATPTKENTAEFTYSFAWTPQIQTVQGAATYRAQFTPIKNKYAVTLRSNNDAVCSFTGAGIYDYGTEITIGVILNSDDYEFLGWEEDESLAQSFTTTVTGDISLMAKIGSEDVTMDMTLGINQHPVVPDGMTINIRNLTLISEGDESAQLSGHVENLKIWGDAIFWLDKEFDARIWYAVAVPWTVDVAHGIYSVDEYGEPAARQIVANTFDIIALNSAANAAGAEPKDCWNYVDEMDGLLHPGKAYLIYLTEDQPDGLMFFKKIREPLLTTTTNVITTGGDGARDNWNAIANPALYYAEMETGATIGQKYDGETDSYEPFDIDGYEWIVGEPFFMQAATPKTIVAEELGGGFPAPARHALNAENDIADMHCTVELTNNGKLADRLFIATTEEKDDAYIIGQDVAKMGVSNKTAQMWVNRYDTKLCMNTIEPMDNRAEYPLSIFAPKAGEYTISLKNSESSSSNATLYLTRDGEAIWNLSDNDYVLQLDKGTTNKYGLRVSARSPQIATGCDEVIADGGEGVQKVLVNDVVYIIRGDKVYTIDGQLAK